MKKIFILLLAVMITTTLALCGYAATNPTTTTTTSKVAIEASKAMQTVKDKVNYLIGQAKSFYSSKKFQDVINVSQYILTNLDKNSKQAQSLLERARNQIAAMAQKKADEVRAKISGFGKQK